MKLLTRVSWIGFLASAFLVAPACHALTFNVTYDSSTADAPPGFFTAFQSAIDFLQTNFTNPISINIQVGWGKINGQELATNSLAQSLSSHQGPFTYAQVRGAIVNAAKSYVDGISIASLPESDPTGGAVFGIPNAEAKALGLLPPNRTNIDGYVGFKSTAAYTFDPANRAVAGKNDFIGVAFHEITEVMGRYGVGQIGGTNSGLHSPLDLFRYVLPGQLDLAPTNGAYFSIDGGNQIINTFNGTNGGDLSDWLGLTLDSFNHAVSVGKQMEFSTGDLIEMDVLGYDLAPVQPSLTIQSAGKNAVVLRWTLLASGFDIQTNSSLTAANWTSCDCPVSIINGTNFSATIEFPATGNLFFRLVH